MPSQFDLVYKVDKTTALTADVLNVRFRNLDTRLVGLEALNISWQAALAVVQDKVLSASEAVIASLRDQLVQVTQLEWLVAGSGSTITLAEGATLALVVLPDDRALFAPGPYSIVSDVTDPAHYAVVQSLSYSRDIGQYNFKVVGAFGAAKPGSDWQIAAVAGSTLAQQSYLGAGQAARDTAVSAAAAALADRELADADAAQTALDRQATAADAASASTSASSAATSAAQAARFAGGAFFMAQSKTSLPVALGTVQVLLTPATAQGYVPCQWLALVSAADPRNAMAGLFAGYDPSTGTLTLAVQVAQGGGVHNDWTVTPTLPPAMPSIIDDGFYDGAQPVSATPIIYTAAAPTTADDGTF